MNVVKQSLDLKYLLAYSIPICTLIAIHFGKSLSYTTVIFVFILVPILENFLPSSKENKSENSLNEKSTKSYYDLLLFLNVFIIYGLVIYLAIIMNSIDHDLFEIIGIVLSLGICLGSNGINVAHELGHKQGKLHQFFAKALLLPSFYMHFIIEHNKGHHIKVGTLEDPATSRYNENVYTFWVRSIYLSFLSAWSIETKELIKKNNSIWSIQNQMIQFLLIQLAYIIIISYFFNLIITVYLVFAGLAGIILLETINYIEHYGLLRNKNKNGKYERVENFHSWNSNHQVGRILLYELTRHSDHHYKAYKKYQTLLHYDESPQLPYGYPTSILIALFPKLWFSIMNPLVNVWNQQHSNHCN